MITMEAKHFFAASRFFAGVCILSMALTLLSSYKSSLINMVRHSGAIPEVAPAPVPVEVCGKGRKTRKPKKSPALPPAPLQANTPAKPEESPWTPFTLITFAATIVSTLCGIISMLLGWRADRRVAGREESLSIFSVDEHSPKSRGR